MIGIRQITKNVFLFYRTVLSDNMAPLFQNPIIRGIVEQLYTKTFRISFNFQADIYSIYINDPDPPSKMCRIRTSSIREKYGSSRLYGDIF